MRSTFKTMLCAITLSLAFAACGSNNSSEGDATETNAGDTAVVVDNDSLANPPAVVDSMK